MVYKNSPKKSKKKKYQNIQQATAQAQLWKSIALKKVGDKVSIGDPIATMGNSGLESKSYHLHFELWYNGVPVNPIEYMSIY